MVLERSNRWWLFLAFRVGVALAVAVAAHGLTDSNTLAVVLLFAVIGALDYVERPVPERPRPPGPLPIPRHPLVALTCGAIAIGSWAITHYALHGHGQEAAPGVTYIALAYIWILRSAARDSDVRVGSSAGAVSRPAPAGRTGDFDRSIASAVGETLTLKSRGDGYVLTCGENTLGYLPEFGRGESGVCDTADGSWRFFNPGGDRISVEDQAGRRVASFAPAMAGGTIRLGKQRYRLRPPLVGRDWRLRRGAGGPVTLSVRPSGSKYELRLAARSPGIEDLALLAMLSLAAITWSARYPSSAAAPMAGPT